MTKVVVKQSEEEEVPIEILASSIVAIAKAMKKISESRLTQKTIITLLHDHTKVSKREIGYILNSLDALEEIFLKKA